MVFWYYCYFGRTPVVLEVSTGSGCLCVSKPHHQASVPLESATQGALKIQFQNGEQVLRTFFTSAAWLVFVSVIDRETQTTEQPESDL